MKNFFLDLIKNKNHKEDIVVYWSPVDYSLLFHNFEPAVKELTTFKLNLNQCTETDLLKCPAVKDNLKNTFTVKCPFEYDIACTENGIESTVLTKEFFDSQTLIRDAKAGFLSLRCMPIVFFTEGESLIMEQKNAIYSNNDFIKNVTVIEGRYDIGKWFRILDFAFIINHKNKFIKVAAGDTLQYIRFNTDRKIKFKKFYCTEEIYNISQHISNYRGHAKKLINLTGMLGFYESFTRSKMKKLLLKQIKNNLME